MPPNLTAPTFLTAAELASIKADYQEALSEGGLCSETVTYIGLDGTTGSAAYDPATGTVTSPYTEDSLTAIVGAVTEEESIRNGVDGRAATHKVLLRTQDLTTPNQAPQAGDKIRRADGTVLEVLTARFNHAVGMVVCFCAVYGGE